MMRWARRLVLLFAIGSAIGAALTVRKVMDAPRVALGKTPQPDVEILVVRHAIAVGEAVAQDDLRWQSWPVDGLPSGAIARRLGVAVRPFEPALARYPLLEGEPVVEAKLVRPGDGSLAAALIAPGKRAVAVPVREESAAGGLIQPNDRVDVLWTRRGGDNRMIRPVTRTLLRSVKVLAVGKSVHLKTTSARGRTATLELTPAQARAVESAKASGEISLALVPIGERAAANGDEAVELPGDEAEPGIKILKFGQRSAVRQPSWRKR